MYKRYTCFQILLCICVYSVHVLNESIKYCLNQNHDNEMHLLDSREEEAHLFKTNDVVS